MNAVHMETVDLVAVIIGWGIVIAIAAILFVFAVRRKRAEAAQKAMTAPETVHAELYGRESSKGMGKTTYTLIFRTDDGRTIRIKMARDEYYAFRESIPCNKDGYRIARPALTMTYQGLNLYSCTFDRYN